MVGSKNNLDANKITFPIASCRTASSKQDYFMTAVHATEAKVVIETETLLTENICDDDLLFSELFHCFRKDCVCAQTEVFFLLFGNVLTQ